MKLTTKVLASILALAGLCTAAHAQDNAPKVKVVNDIKFSGYVMTQYTASGQKYAANGQKDAESNSFNLRMVRMALDGKFFNEFYWKAQVQLNGNTSTLGSSPRLVDAFMSGRNAKRHT